jgi:hypothetical protein
MPADSEDDRLRITDPPDQFDLIWVTDSIFGQPQPNHRSRRERRGWVPVHQDDFDGRYNGRFMAADKPGEINVDGMVLMARPLAWSKQAKAEDSARAGAAVRIKSEGISSGALLRETRPSSAFMSPEHPSARKVSGVRRTLERLEVPQSSPEHGE